MSPRSKGENREAVHLRYKNAPRNGKTAILDEFLNPPPNFCSFIVIVMLKNLFLHQWVYEIRI